MTASGALTEEQISLPSRNFSPSRALVPESPPRFPQRLCLSTPAARLWLQRRVQCVARKIGKTPDEARCGSDGRQMCAVACRAEGAAVSSMARWLGVFPYGAEHLWGSVSTYMGRYSLRHNTQDGLHLSSAECASCRTCARTYLGLPCPSVHSVLQTSLST
jgi:hypothetical protein